MNHLSSGPESCTTARTLNATQNIISGRDSSMQEFAESGLISAGYLGAKKNRPGSSIRSPRRFLVKDSGDNRLSRQRHYHRPGGLNGRVRNGNGCDPASMVAGKVPGRRSSRAGHGGFRRLVAHEAHTHKDEWVTAPRLVSKRPLNGPFYPIGWLAVRRALSTKQGSAPIGVVKLLGC